MLYEMLSKGGCCRLCSSSSRIDEQTVDPGAHGPVPGGTKPRPWHAAAQKNAGRLLCSRTASPHHVHVCEQQREDSARVHQHRRDDITDVLYTYVKHGRCARSRNTEENTMTEQTMTTLKQIIYSGIQPSGRADDRQLHRRAEATSRCLRTSMIASTRLWICTPSPSGRTRRSCDGVAVELAALYIAAGLNPDKSI